VADHPAAAAGAMAAFTAHGLATGTVSATPGSHGLAEVVEPLTVLAALASLGIGVVTFEGAD
jgi:hypothetical protein